MEGGSRTDPSTPMIHKMIQWMIGIVLRSGGMCVCVCVNFKTGRHRTAALKRARPRPGGV